MSTVEKHVHESGDPWQSRRVWWLPEEGLQHEEWKGKGVWWEHGKILMPKSEK